MVTFYCDNEVLVLSHKSLTFLLKYNKGLIISQGNRKEI